MTLFNATSSKRAVYQDIVNVDKVSGLLLYKQKGNLPLDHIVCWIRISTKTNDNWKSIQSILSKLSNHACLTKVSNITNKKAPASVQNI